MRVPPALLEEITRKQNLPLVKNDSWGDSNGENNTKQNNNKNKNTHTHNCCVCIYVEIKLSNMPWCSWEQHFVSQNMFLAALIRWVCFQSGFLEGLAPISSAICILIFCRYIPVSRDILSKKVSLLQNRLVGELAGNQAGFLSAYLLLESTRSWGMFHFDR